MRVVIAGGTGFLGRPLAESYAGEGHDVRVLTRALPPGESRPDQGSGVPGITRVGWNPDGQSGRWAAAIDGADVLLNLAGEGLGDKRWTARRKAQLRDSRVIPTRSLVAALGAVAAPPGVFISGSAVGYYGASDELKTESSPAGDTFLGHICEDWEAEARRAEACTRVVLLRTGVVLERSGGALPQMALPFRLFAGGPMGSGRQYLSWIHRLDWIGMVRWLAEMPGVSGAVNATAPTPVTNREFAKALGRALGRPSLIPAPGFALELLLGEMAGPLILTGQRVVPTRAQELGFRFRYQEIEQALRAIYAE